MNPVSAADESQSYGQQLTSDQTNHILTNTGVWSHDGKWIYYDVRSDAAGSQFDGTRIERVHIETSDVETVYRSARGACCGVVTASPTEDRIVFIHGPEDPTTDWQYAKWHRRGVIMQPGRPDSAATLDARDLSRPFTAGALRGGSHVHVFSGDGRWVSFTYEDHVLETSADGNAQHNQRNIAVTAPIGAVTVPKTHSRNHDGTGFSVLVSRTWDTPRPGTDQIQRADGDAWVGSQGYLRKDGSRQHRAIAFIGDVVDPNGNIVSELFIVDIPDDVTVAGDEPLCGTELTRPAPPKGTIQRRLTHTTNRPYPGLGTVRHWVRSSPDGSRIAFLLRDDAGVVQLWTISPTGDEMRQLTHNRDDVESAFTFRCDGQAIACVVGGRVCEVDIQTGETTPLTPSSTPELRPRPEAAVYSPDGTQIAYVRRVPTGNESLNQIFVVKGSKRR